MKKYMQKKNIKQLDFRRPNMQYFIKSHIKNGKGMTEKIKSALYCCKIFD